MKQELNQHLRPLAFIFVTISAFWIFKHAGVLSFIELLLGLGLGSFFLDLDHVIYWLYLEPNLEESKLAQTAIHQKKYKDLLRLLESNHKQHINLIFHHFFFQIILALVSVFIFTSSNSVFTKALVLSLNVHLLVDEIADFKTNPSHLQDWLFAREPKQIPLQYLKHYLTIFTGTCLLFFYILLRSKG